MLCSAQLRFPSHAQHAATTTNATICVYNGIYCAELHSNISLNCSVTFLGRFQFGCTFRKSLFGHFYECQAVLLFLFLMLTLVLLLRSHRKLCGNHRKCAHTTPQISPIHTLTNANKRAHMYICICKCGTTHTLYTKSIVVCRCVCWYCISCGYFLLSLENIPKLIVAS